MELLVYIVLVIISTALAKPPSQPAASLDDYQIPTVDPSRERPVLFGEGLVQDPNTVWYGDEDSRKSGDYRLYYLGLHTTWTYSSSRFDMALKRILVGEKTAWVGNVTSNARIRIVKFSLFGGKSREGGLFGYIDIMFGGETQGKNAYLQSRQGSLNSAYRGMTSFVWNKVYFAANSPYFKQPWALWKSIPNHWYTEKAEINGQCNPAHIVHACLTDIDFGLGLLGGELNDDNFRAVADTLFDEGLGASFQWSRQSSINEFLQQVIDHMGGTLDVNPLTGQYEMSLIRNDYVVSSLPLFDESNISSMVKYEGADYTSLKNEIVVKYIDKENGLQKSISLQNAAAIAANGGTVNSHGINYSGVVSDEQAVLLATRDLQALSAPLHKLEILVDRSAWQLRRGQVFRHSWAKHEVVNQVYRIGDIVKDTGKEGKIRITAVEDVFGLPLATYTSGGGSLYVPPSTDAEDLTRVLLREATYYENQHRLAAYELEALGAEFGVPSVLVAKEKSLDVEYEIAVSNSPSNHVVTAVGDFAPYAETAAAVPLAEASTLISCINDDRLDLVELNTWAQMGDEIVEVTAVDLLLNTITVNRGVLDTHPKAHPINTPIYFADGLVGRDPTAHSNGETVHVKLLPSTSEDQLDLASATNRSLVLNNRHERPYPPGNVRMNLAYFPVSITGELTVSWSHRDRTQMLTFFHAWDLGGVGLEVGVTYTLEIYGDGGGLKHTETGLTGTNYIYPTATEEAENGGMVNSSLRIVLWSVRDGWDSYEKFDFSFTRV